MSIFFHKKDERITYTNVYHFVADVYPLSLINKVYTGVPD